MINILRFSFLQIAIVVLLNVIYKEFEFCLKTLYNENRRIFIYLN